MVFNKRNIVQSVILSGIFYGFGLALFGRLSVAQSLLIAIVVYAGQVAFSARWIGQVPDLVPSNGCGGH